MGMYSGRGADSNLVHNTPTLPHVLKHFAHTQQTGTITHMLEDNRQTLPHVIKPLPHTQQTYTTTCGQTSSSYTKDRHYHMWS